MGQFEVRARLKIREGQLEGFKRQAAELMRQAREKDTGTVAYDWYVSSDGTQCEVREALWMPMPLSSMPSMSARLATPCSATSPTTTR